MKRIYYITNMFPGKHDNYGIFCKKIYDFFNSSEDFSIIKISAIKGKSYNKYWNIIRYMVLLLSILYNLVFCVRQYDIVYVQYVWKHAFFVSHFLKRIKKNNKHLFINFHGEDLTEYNHLKYKEKKQFKELCDYCSGIIVPSCYFMNLLNQTLEFDYTDKVIVSPSGGVNSTVFFKKNNCKKECIVYCSRFDSDKGWDDFIIAVKKISSTRPTLNFIMIGYGAETEAVKRMVKEYELNDKIEVIINPNQELIARLYTESSLFIFPTRRQAESLGLVALEAMSCGLPVIGSQIGAVEEYVENDVTGYLYEPGNISELVSKIEIYMNLSEEEKRKLQENAIKTAEIYSEKNVKLVFLESILRKIDI